MMQTTGAVLSVALIVALAMDREDLAKGLFLACLVVAAVAGWYGVPI